MGAAAVTEAQPAVTELAASITKGIATVTDLGAANTPF